MAQILTCGCILWPHSLLSDSVQKLEGWVSHWNFTYGIDVKLSNSASKDAFCTTVLRWRKARVVLGSGNTLWNHRNPAGTVKPLIHSAGIFIDIFFSPLDIFCQNADSNPLRKRYVASCQTKTNRFYRLSYPGALLSRINSISVAGMEPLVRSRWLV